MFQTENLQEKWSLILIVLTFLPKIDDVTHKRVQ